MDATAGVFTTFKLQSLLDCGLADGVRSRRDLVSALASAGHRISIHGVEAWFRHVDSNYNLPRDSLCDTHRSYAIPRRRWKTLLDIFGIDISEVEAADAAFRRSCFARAGTGNRPEPPPTELVGRTEELAQLVAAFERGREMPAEGALCLVEGEAGVGKSALLDGAAGEFQRLGALVLRCGCIERADTSLLPMLELLDAHREAMRALDENVVAALDRLLAATQPPGAGDSLFAAVARALSNLAQRKPVAFILDDAHWADESTARLLPELSRVRSAASRSLFVLAAARPETDAGKWPDGIRKAARRGAVLSLGPLDRSQSDRLVGRRLGVLCGRAFLDWIWDRTQGNPFFIEQVLGHLERSGEVDPLRAPAADVDVPRAIAETVAARLDRLRAPTRELLALASVFGGAFHIAELQYAWENSTTQAVIGALEEAEHAGFVIYNRDRFRFSHPLLRQTIYDRLAESRRAYLHFTLSQRMIDRDGESPLVLLEVAGHLLRGRMFADGKSLARACMRAARVAHGFEAWDQVVRFAKAALEAGGEGALAGETQLEMERLAGLGLHQTGNPREAVQFHQRVADAHARSGDIVEAARALTNVCRIRANYAIPSARQSRDVDSLIEALPALREADARLAAWTLDTIAIEYFTKDRERAEDCIDDALALLETREPCWEHALVLAEAGLLSLARADPVTACRHFAHGEAMARAAQDRGTVARCLQRLAVAQLALGRLDELRTTAQSIELLGDDATETGEQTVALAAELAASVLQGAGDAAARTYADARQLLEQTGYAGALDMVHGARAAGLAVSGEGDAARAVLDDEARWRLGTAGTVAAAPFTSLRRRMALLVEDLEDPHPGRAIPDDLLLRPPTGTRYPGNMATFAIGLEIAIRRGSDEQVRLAMPVLAEAFRRGTVVTMVWPMICPLLLARAAHALGEKAAARAYLSVALDVVRRMKSPHLLEQAVELAGRLGVPTGPFGIGD